MRSSATALRILSPVGNVLGTGDPDSLQNINTTELPDGAVCVVRGIGIYLLDKTNTLTPVGTTIVQPGSGTGFWVLVTQDVPVAPVLAAQSVLSTAFAPVTVTTSGGQGKWTVFPTSAYNGFFDPTLWSFDATTGVLTYLGPDAMFEVTAYLSAAPSTAAIARIGLDVDINGNLVGTTTTTVETMEFQTGADTADQVSLATSWVGGIHPGNTVRAVARNSAAATDITGIALTLVVRPF